MYYKAYLLDEAGKKVTARRSRKGARNAVYNYNKSLHTRRKKKNA